jgi:phage terminase large subunit-like protein
MRDVRDGKVIDDSSMPILYEFPDSYIKNKLYLKPENFYITNPNINRSVNPDWIERELQKALKKPDNSKQKFLAKHLNLEIDFALRDDNWVGAEYWVKASRKFRLDYIINNSEVITIGIDGGGLDDLLGLYILGRDADNNWMGYGKAWTTKTALNRRQEIAPKLHDFHKEGDVVIVDDVGEDLDELIDLIVMIDKTDLLDKIGCDPAGIGDILDGLELAGIEKEKIVGVSQGWRLGGAIKTTERRLADGSLTVSDQNLMKWCVSNAKVEQRANSILITKQSSGTGKIDPLMAMFGAVYLMALNPESKGGLSFVLDPIIG